MMIELVFIVRFFIDAVHPHGNSFWYADMPNLYIFNSSAPNPRSLGATNGLSRTNRVYCSVHRSYIVRVTFFRSLWRTIFSVTLAFTSPSLHSRDFAVCLAIRLPSKPWNEHEPKQFDTEDR